MKATSSLLFADFPAFPMANVGNTELAAKVPAAVDKKFLRFIPLEYHISDQLTTISGSKLFSQDPTANLRRWRDATLIVARRDATIIVCYRDVSIND
jgi:hypothetical protein